MTDEDRAVIREWWLNRDELSVFVGHPVATEADLPCPPEHELEMRHVEDGEWPDIRYWCSVLKRWVKSEELTEAMADEIREYGTMSGMTFEEFLKRGAK